MDYFYAPQVREWAGLTQFPSSEVGFASTPVFMTGVRHSHVQKGCQEFDFIQPLHPGGAARRRMIGKIVQRARGHITCLFEDGMQKHTAVFTAPTFDWLENHCPELLRRRPCEGAIDDIYGKWERPTWAEYLTFTFGSTPDEILAGVTGASHEVSHHPMPAERSLLTINRRLSAYDSCLAARGHCPRVMEDKWFIYIENGRLLFRRSWTGMLVFDLEAYWSGEQLYLAQAYVNRCPTQYNRTDDAADTALLQHLINSVLLGLPDERDDLD